MLTSVFNGSTIALSGILPGEDPRCRIRCGYLAGGETPGPTLVPGEGGEKARQIELNEWWICLFALQGKVSSLGSYLRNRENFGHPLLHREVDLSASSVPVS